ncbi:hypothetical protein B1207_15030 [Legionella quinlivanii]|uniref:histidine kinase n=1 Tax=Legionella quinlivanii TaxID=45073 RepID=A0A364LFM4_9GAMM|nr:PAS domain-containing hybrid sensor histidine kinase/response regulator [Legionella quinlivanii]RAP34763.1 hypothetical protein B1207_15030 [Legionella quinlivanii]
MGEKKDKIHLTINEVGDFLAKFSEHSDQVYWISSPDFKKIQYISPSFERIWGRSREQLYNNPSIWMDFLHPDDAMDHNPISEMAEKVSRLGERARYSEHYRIIRPDGEIRWIIDNGFPLFDEQGVCYGVTGVATDVTEDNKRAEALREAKELAEAANIAKDEFLANMSHDIRTPITGIISMSNLLEENANTQEEMQYSRWIHESGTQLLALLNGVLEIVSSGNIQEKDLHYEHFSLRKLIKDIVQLEQPSVLMRKLEFLVDIKPDVPDWFISDRIKIHRILLNLLGNAIKFTQEGHVGVSIQKLSEEENNVTLEFSVFDSGLGISEEAQAKVFDRFFKVNPSNKAQYQGHGVGLHIVKTYVELLGGEINLSSTIGKGTRFYFKLPMVLAEPDISYDEKYQDDEKLNSDHEISNHEARLLLVEDNPVALKTVEIMAQKSGCHYQIATSGEEALQLLQQQPFDLIISDLGLPGISGHEMLNRLRELEQQEGRAAIPFVGLTAQSLSSSNTLKLPAGMNKLISKPVTLPAFQGLLKEFIAEDKFVHHGSDNKELHYFALSGHALFDETIGIANLGDFATLREMLSLLLEKELPAIGEELTKAHSGRDWQKVARLAHKLKSSAMYCGNVRLQWACQCLEEYHLSGHTALLEQLYQQLLTVINDTAQTIKERLSQ